ncbi:MAG: class I SAM-dependent methyltransferase [Spirochaetota bacterium]|nr:class I SAM-dependent methyltransferase [Spirochaetota bacterium]
MDISNYLTELILWNTTHNLVSKNEINNLEEHVDDSFSLCELIKETKHHTIIDIGSGGGFPIIPLGFWIKEEKLPITLIATDIKEKKLSFLTLCSRKFELDIKVENLTKKFIFEQECLIISRAFSSLTNILIWRDKHAPLAKDFLILKGNTVEEELKEAQILEYKLIKNPRGYIVQFTHLPACK